MKMGRRPRCPLAPVRLGPPCRRPIFIATKYLVFQGQDTSMVNGLIVSVLGKELWEFIGHWIKGRQ
jgi:hypothetical protein